VINEGTIYFHSHDGCIASLQSVRRVFESRYNLISLETLHREGFYFSFECDLTEASKEAHVKFQAECVGDIYMFQNSKDIVGGMRLS